MNLTDDQLKTFVVVSITLIWIIVVLTTLFLPATKIDPTVTTMMGAVVGYFLVDKFKSKKP